MESVRAFALAWLWHGSWVLICVMCMLNTARCWTLNTGDVESNVTNCKKKHSQFDTLVQRKLCLIMWNFIYICSKRICIQIYVIIIREVQRFCCCCFLWVSFSHEGLWCIWKAIHSQARAQSMAVSHHKRKIRIYFSLNCLHLLEFVWHSHR